MNTTPSIVTDRFLADASVTNYGILSCIQAKYFTQIKKMHSKPKVESFTKEDLVEDFKKAEKYGLLNQATFSKHVKLLKKEKGEEKKPIKKRTKTQSKKKKSTVCLRTRSMCLSL